MSILSILAVVATCVDANAAAYERAVISGPATTTTQNAAEPTYITDLKANNSTNFAAYNATAEHYYLGFRGADYDQPYAKSARRVRLHLFILTSR
jgi:hypothetical protein